MNDTQNELNQSFEERSTGQDTALPSLTIKINDQLYCLNIRYVADIIPCPSAVTELPDAPAYVRGVINLRGQIVPLAPLRTLLSMPTVEDEQLMLTEMLEVRKQDHLNWVGELERCITCGDPFELATDPHKCAFGKWYYAYKPKSLVLQHHMKKIEDPHTRLHQAALAYTSQQHDCTNCNRSKCLKEILLEVKLEIVPHLLQLLDETTVVQRESQREMVVVLQSDTGESIGLVADEVLAVGRVTPVDSDVAMQSFGQSPFVTGIMTSPSHAGNVLALDDGKLLALIGA